MFDLIPCFTWPANPIQMKLSYNQSKIVSIFILKKCETWTEDSNFNNLNTVRVNVRKLWFILQKYVNSLSTGFSITIFVTGSILTSRGPNYIWPCFSKSQVFLFFFPQIFFRMLCFIPCILSTFNDYFTQSTTGFDNFWKYWATRFFTW